MTGCSFRFGFIILAGISSFLPILQIFTIGFMNTEWKLYSWKYGKPSFIGYPIVYSRLFVAVLCIFNTMYTVSVPLMKRQIPHSKWNFWFLVIQAVLILVLMLASIIVICLMADNMVDFVKKGCSTIPGIHKNTETMAAEIHSCLAGIDQWSQQQKQNNQTVPDELGKFGEFGNVKGTSQFLSILFSLCEWMPPLVKPIALHFVIIMDLSNAGLVAILAWLVQVFLASSVHRQKQSKASRSSKSEGPLKKVSTRRRSTRRKTTTRRKKKKTEKEPMAEEKEEKVDDTSLVTAASSDGTSNNQQQPNKTIAGFELPPIVSYQGIPPLQQRVRDLVSFEEKQPATMPGQMTDTGSQ